MNSHVLTTAVVGQYLCVTGHFFLLSDATDVAIRDFQWEAVSWPNVV